ncbi:aldehyde dehydrogenase family protein [Brevibacillus humidisoli]|uniref:aldehyde dehydrogenase family protein n=1 Tax=Brevibacillus humidisoli TaxID=2895522 RepID=UPI001E3138F2|nr:aldehyde dehydrogenase family protein [Brevibacillus humidisoli]UFJ39896.1 aldehyde dehydrogenase family protein [Brevibacillus humidisoli]
MVKKHLFINGTWVEAREYRPLYSPFSGELLAEVAFADEADVDKAVAAAEQARPVMAQMPAHQRASILEKLVLLLEQNAEECARLIALEAAKPIATARGEVSRTVMTYKFAAEEAKRIHGETIPMDAAAGGENRVAYTVRRPLGVVAAITPFNFPMNLVAHKVGPAIAAGNPIVLKPATQTPLSSLFLAELLQQAGMPPGAFNVVTGSGGIVGERLIQDERVKMITFTGSPAVGIAIRNKAGLKRVTLELGSNSALIVDQGVDLDTIIPRAVSGAFAFAGQVCISLQRVYVHEQVYDQFVEKFVEKAKSLKVGSPLEEDSDLSALISPKDVERSLAWIEEAKQQGAVVAAGGIRDGNCLYPTVLLDVDPGAKVSCQEVFAPIVLINKISSVAEGIAHVNDSRYGLQAGIYTNDVHTALKAAEQLEVGGVMINDIPTFRVDHMPYGGVKESGVGREGLKYAVEEMTELKLVVFHTHS